VQRRRGGVDDVLFCRQLARMGKFLLLLVLPFLVSCAAVVGQTGPSAATGPVGYWTFDTASTVSNQVGDSSSNHLNGTIVGGVTSTTGVLNQALSFDGHSGYLQFPSDTLTDLTSNISLALWVKTSNNSRTEAILSRYSAAGMEAGYILRSDPAGHVELRIGGNNSAGGYAVTLTDTGSINDGKWHHVAAVITLGGGVKFYIDGTPSSTQTLNVVGRAGGSSLDIGLTPVYYGAFFTGSLDEVRIYNRVLSASEITALASVQTPTPTPPPTPTPALSVTPQNLSFSATSGSSGPAPQTVNITNSGGGTLTWTASANQPWITLSSVSGTGAQSVSVGTVISGLTAGTHSGTVTITAAGATPSVQTVNVVLVMTPVPPPTGGSGPVGYWQFDSAKVVGNQILDSSGNNLSGTLLGGVKSTTGVVNQGLSFDGRSGYIQFPDDTLTELTSDLSLAFWVNTQNNSRTEAILSRYSAAGIEMGYILRSDPAGHVELRIGGNNSGTGYAVTLTDTGRINDGKWHYVTAVITRGQGVSFYIDGALSSKQALNVVGRAGGSSLEIGLTPVYYGTYFTGILDEVRIYNRVLSAAEIAALASSQTPTPPPTATPALSVTPQNLSFNATSGSSGPASQTVNITNSGGGTLTWTASASQPWITLSSASGTGAQSVSVGTAISGLTAGTHSGTVTISAAGATPSVQTVNVTLLIASVLPPPGGGSGAQYYVTPSGSSSGNGSINNPWDLQTALNQPSSVHPGDTIWLRNGVYGNGGTIFQANLNGTSAQPITLRQYPGERATVNGGLQVNGTYARYWGFEVANMVIANRNSGTAGQNPIPNFPSGFTIYGTGNQFINLVVHDTAEGFGFWTAAQGGEIYGSLIYYNGWQGTDRGHGHNIYTQNQTGVKTISDNIIFQGFGEGVQCYGSGNAYVQNYVFDGNTIFNSGALAGNHQYNLLITGGHGPQNITVTNNYTYHTPSDNTGMSALDWGGQLTATNLTATGNYWIGGNPAILAFNWKGATFTGNTAYSQGGYTLSAGNLQPNTYTWDNNKYYGGGFQLNSGGTTFAGWQSTTGLDKNSTATASAPTGTWVFVRPNKYETGRANITIYNWNLGSTVVVDVSNVLTLGKHYEVRNAQDFFGAPVLSGTYNGGSISIPMAGLIVAQPQGVVPNQPKPVGPGFGAFVLLEQ